MDIGWKAWIGAIILGTIGCYLGWDTNKINRIILAIICLINALFLSYYAISTLGVK